MRVSEQASSGPRQGQRLAALSTVFVLATATAAMVAGTAHPRAGRPGAVHPVAAGTDHLLALFQAGGATYDAASHTLKLRRLERDGDWFTDRPQRDMGTDGTGRLLGQLLPLGATVSAAVTTPSGSQTFALSQVRYDARSGTATFDAAPFVDRSSKWAAYTSTRTTTLDSDRGVTLFVDRDPPTGRSARVNSTPGAAALVRSSGGRYDATAHTLALSGVADPSTMFTDQPIRSFAKHSIATIVKRFFDAASRPPNAALVTTARDGGPASVILTLDHPQYDANAHVLTLSTKTLTDRTHTRWARASALKTVTSGAFSSAVLMIDDAYWPNLSLVEDAPTVCDQSNSWSCAAMRTEPYDRMQQITSWSAVASNASSHRDCGIAIDLTALSGVGGVVVTLNTPSHGAIDGFNQQYFTQSGGTPVSIVVPYGTRLRSAAPPNLQYLNWALVDSATDLTGCEGTVDLTDWATGTPLATFSYDNPDIGTNSTGCSGVASGIECSAAPAPGDQALFQYGLAGVAQQCTATVDLRALPPGKMFRSSAVAAEFETAPGEGLVSFNGVTTPNSTFIATPWMLETSGSSSTTLQYGQRARNVVDVESAGPWGTCSGVLTLTDQASQEPLATLQFRGAAASPYVACANVIATLVSCSATATNSSPGVVHFDFVLSWGPSVVPPTTATTTQPGLPSYCYQNFGGSCF